MPTFHFKPPFPEFRSQPEEGVHDVTDVTDDADVTDDVVTATAKLAAAVVNDDEPEVTSDLAEVFTSGQRQDGMSACKEVSTLTGGPVLSYLFSVFDPLTGMKVFKFFPDFFFLFPENFSLALQDPILIF